MDWTTDEMDRLYGLYERHIDRLRADVAEANRSLGSLKPEHTGLACVTRAEFESLLGRPEGDPEVIRLWVRRIIRGHEHDFPRLVAEEGSFRPHPGASDSKTSHVRRRNTGT